MEEILRIEEKTADADPAHAARAFQADFTFSPDSNELLVRTLEAAERSDLMREPPEHCMFGYLSIYWDSGWPDKIVALRYAFPSELVAKLEPALFHPCPVSFFHSLIEQYYDLKCQCIGIAVHPRALSVHKFARAFAEEIQSPVPDAVYRQIAARWEPLLPAIPSKHITRIRVA